MNTRKRSREISFDTNQLMENSNDRQNEEEEEEEQRSNPTKKIKLKIPRILDGKFFSIISNVEGKLEARCTECGVPKKGLITTTGNFKTHYKLSHPIVYQKLNEYLKEKSTVAAVNVSQQQNLDCFLLSPTKVIICYGPIILFEMFINLHLYAFDVFTAFGE